MSEISPSDSLRIAIAGVAGRMGRQLVGAALDAGLDVTGGSEAPASDHLGMDIGELAGRRLLNLKPATDPVAAAGNAEVWIDFTRPAATIAALDSLKHTSVRAAIIGTTGFSPSEEAEIDRAAQSLAIVKAGNFSIGVNLLQALTRLAAERLGPEWDIEISETHHRRKVDAPSGTALMIGEAAAQGRGKSLSDLKAAPYNGPDAKRRAGNIGFAVRRMGGVIGAHDVSFGSDMEILSLSHTAVDRAVFAHGALGAAAWAVKQAPGLYTMDDVLGLSGN